MTNPNVLAWLIAALFVVVSMGESSHAWLSVHGTELASLQTEFKALKSKNIELRDTNLEREALHTLLAYPDGLPEGVSEFENYIIGNDDIAVRRSLIPGAGRGAFARRQFEAGEQLAEFKCVVVANDADTSKYTWSVNNTHSCDSISIPLYNPIMYANSIASEASCSQQNADLSILPSGQLFYVATRPIMEGEEILYDSGPGYFMYSDVTYECHMTRLQIASSRGDIDTTAALLADSEVRRTVDTVDTFGWTPLMLACEKGHLEVAKLLVEAGADVDRQTTSHTLATPLHIAAEKGHTEVVKFLLDSSNTNVNKEMARGFTPLMVAVGRGYVDIAEELVKSGASISKALEDGNTPITIAKHYGHFEIAEMLVEVGNSQNKTAPASANGKQYSQAIEREVACNF